MKTLPFLKPIGSIVLFSFLFSCKDPVPVYFPQVPGTVIDSFPYKVCGSYLGFDDIIRKEMSEKQALFPNHPDDLKYVEAKTDFEQSPDTGKNVLLKFNKLSCEKLLAPIDSVEGLAKRKIKFAVLRIIPSGLDFDFIDSLGERSSLAIFRTDTKNKITSYKEDYFLAQKTDHGWELVMIDFHHKDLFSVRVPWFTSYDPGAKDVKAFDASMQKTAKGLKSLLNKEGQVIGLTVVLKPDEIVELFKKSDTDPVNFHRY